MYFLLACTVEKQMCVFPFKYDGTSYSSCTEAGANGLWCATSTYSGGSVKTWGFCGDQQCTGDTRKTF